LIDVSVEAQLARLLSLLVGGEKLDDFMRRVTPRFPLPQHLLPLIRKLEEASYRPIRLVVCMPPRHGKSISLLHSIAWMMRRWPQLKHSYATYGQDFSRSQSRALQRIALDAGLRTVIANVDNWTIHGGGCVYATSIGGPLTGKGINGLAIIDDPFKDREEAESPVIREKVWEWFTDVLCTRLEPGASIVVVQTRWHADDLAGRLLSGSSAEKWDSITLPAINDAGEALWPEQMPLESLEILRKTNAYSFASLYMQSPVPRGAAVFREPATFTLRNWQRDGYRLVVAVDPAASAKTHADYSVALVLAMRGHAEQSEARVVDVLRAQQTVPDFVRSVVRLREKWGQTVPVVVEAVGGFAAVPDLIREIAPSMAKYVVAMKSTAEVKMSSDKYTRAQPVASAWNDGRVMVPSDAPWANSFVSEVLAFTGLGDPHDDQVDALAHAFNSLYRARPPLVRGEREVDFATH
jgi:predicted phage terminase large subunit-like protein